jgi:diguanylate cyclase (GGDEF)-like protein
LLLIQIGLLLGPGLAYDFLSGIEHGVSYGVATLVFFSFHAFQGYRLHDMYWDLLADRAREVKRTHELESAQEMLRYRATHDQLTGLVNRGQILSVLEREIERATRSGTPLGIVMLDLDHFKEVNDQFGHLGGDEVLCGVAKRLQASVRPYDAVGRYGGEEFLIVLPGCDIEESAASAERIRERIEDQPLVLLKAQARVTASFGVSVFLPERDTNKRQMIGRADKALYLAKQRGRNRVEVFVPQPKVLTSATL